MQPIRERTGDILEGRWVQEMPEVEFAVGHEGRAAGPVLAQSPRHMGAIPCSPSANGVLSPRDAFSKTVRAVEISPRIERCGGGEESPDLVNTGEPPERENDCITTRSVNSTQHFEESQREEQYLEYTSQ